MEGETTSAQSESENRKTHAQLNALELINRLCLRPTTPLCRDANSIDYYVRAYFDAGGDIDWMRITFGATCATGRLNRAVALARACNFTKADMLGKPETVHCPFAQAFGAQQYRVVNWMIDEYKIKYVDLLDKETGKLRNDILLAECGGPHESLSPKASDKWNDPKNAEWLATRFLGPRSWWAVTPFDQKYHRIAGNLDPFEYYDDDDVCGTKKTKKRRRTGRKIKTPRTTPSSDPGLFFKIEEPHF